MNVNLFGDMDLDVIKDHAEYLQDEIEGISAETHVLKLLRNIYGRRAASRTWFLYLKDKLVNELNFVQSKHDECLFYRGNVMCVNKRYS